MPHLISIPELAALLKPHTLTLCQQMFPQGTRQGDSFQIGSLAGDRGRSLSVQISTGAWREYAPKDNRPDRGDILELVAQAMFNGDKRAALRWTRQYLGIDQGDPSKIKTHRLEAERLAREQERKARKQNAFLRGKAWEIWHAESEPVIAGTPVETYLNGRKIDLGRCPSVGALHYHPELAHPFTGELLPAMTAAIVGPDGKFCAVHRTMLEPCDHLGFKQAKRHEPKRKDKKPLAKFVLAPAHGGLISLNKGRSNLPITRLKDDSEHNTCIMCEGIEDALTLAMAIPETRIIAAYSLSNMQSIVFPPAIKRLIIFRDNDEHPDAIKQFQRVVDEQTSRIPDVRTAMLEGYKDANDAIAMGGQQ